MKWVLLCCLLFAGQLRAQALRLPAPPDAQFAPVAGAQLPLDATLVADNGKAIKLGALFGKQPVVLVPGYYTCPNLCSTLFEGVMQALAIGGLPPDAYRLVGLSIDPHDTPARAAEKKRAYASLLPGASLHLLTGSAASIAAVTGAIGYRAVPDEQNGQFAHAAGFVVATPDGRVSSYFPGVRFEPAALRDAVRKARDGQATGLFGKLLLLCAHYDPATGLHTPAAMAVVRIGVLAALLSLGALAWRRARRGQA